MRLFYIVCSIFSGAQAFTSGTLAAPVSASLAQDRSYNTQFVFY